MKAQSIRSLRVGVDRWIGLTLCGAVVGAGILMRFFHTRPAQGGALGPNWLAVAAGVVGAAGIVQWSGQLRWIRLQRGLLWSGLLLMIWTGNGLPFDFLKMAGLIGDPATGRRAGVDWPGFAIRILAMAAVFALARLALARPSHARPAPARWYGYAAFVLALPYPVLRTCWAMGGTLGLGWAGAAGKGWSPCLLAIPWLMAAALSLLLVPTWSWMPRRLLLFAGWTATMIVAMIGPAAVWAFVRTWLKGGGHVHGGIAGWVFGLFYGSWFLWAIAAGAATRSYQLRSAGPGVTTEPSKAVPECIYH